MNLRALRLFREIVLSGSLHEAAKRLNTSTSAASRLILNLEQDLCLPLFSRNHRRLELTEDGDMFYRSILHTLDGLDEIPVVAGDIARRTREWLSVVTAAPLANGLVTPALAQLQHEGCEFRCSVSVETRFDIESKVAARGYNLGLISLPVENSIIVLETVPILRARVGVVLPRAHPLAEREAIALKDIVDEPFIGLRPGQRWRDRTDELLGRTGLRPKFWIETNATPLVIGMVRAGLGVSVIDRVCAGLLPEGDPAVFRPLVDTHWITYASLHPPGVRLQLAERFLDALAASVEMRSAKDADFARDLELL
ncbi:LysR family transcriptional regulator [Roseicitreum antarcticum]|uniref:DNA-binding transcriptional regulator, LysR family n=1 Tax=Roseicitreum antarcticum TaxID=564137 RepID=A0A1H2TNT8_9RHOB|nr:LysR family transcriptional regulator [Roseicitreum antarcticum]SDW45603.1 DNA-binding transcriptional regulator, LysR family [Roseicitreum antarcticum]